MLGLIHFIKRRFDARRPADDPPSRHDWTASDWARVRAPQRHRDQALSLRAQRWLGASPKKAARASCRSATRAS